MQGRGYLGRSINGSRVIRRAAVATASTVFGVSNASCGGANANVDTDSDTPAGGWGELLWGD